MAIQPISIAQAAGVEYGKGDVKHFAPGDALDVPGLQNPTRHLAERDNLIAEKLNEVIESVNNQEQFVPLPLVRTILAPQEEMIVTNYRIPAGFESRVLNASISSSPVSKDIELNVYYSESFGASSGTAVVTTADEYSGGVRFYQEGEFIVALKNKSGQALEIAPSVMLTLRPIGAQGSLLVASVIKGDQGKVGQRGIPGPQGRPGTGGVGSPGMVWKDAWTNATSYVTREAVSYPLYGTLTAAFITKQNHTSSLGVNDPETDYRSGNPQFWSPVSIPAAGPAGPASTGNGRFVYPIFNLCNGTFITGADYVPGSTQLGYLGGGAASTIYPNLALYESVMYDASAGTGVAMLWGQSNRYFRGNGTIRLPQIGDVQGGASANYTTGQVFALVTDNGTNRYNANGTHQVMITQVNERDWVVKVHDAYPVQVSVVIAGGASF